MSNIYRIYLERKAGYDQYQGAVVIAFSEEDAKRMYPAFNKTIPSIQEQKKADKYRTPYIPLHVRLVDKEYREQGPWEVTYHYSDELGYHCKHNGVIQKEENELFKKFQDDEWTSNPDNVKVEFLGVVPENKNYHPRVVMTDYRAG